MMNNNRCGGCRNSNSYYGCLNCLGPRRCRDPCYNEPCPDADGCYEALRGGNGGDDRPNRWDRDRFPNRGSGVGIFTARLPMAVAPNGILPPVNNNCLCNTGGFAVNSGLITVEEEGTCLGTCTARVPEGQTVASNLTLNVNDASRSSAVTEVGGEGPVSFTAQAVFDASERSTVALRSSEAINVTDPSTQPLVTLSLVKI